MMAINIRNKGQRGEREAIELLTLWAAPVTDHLGLPGIDLKRNLMQSMEGGYDVLGLDWLALEVKRHENLQVSQWWKQTLRQTKDQQVPFLMYRQNRTRWRFRVELRAAHYAPCGHSGLSIIVADLDETAAQRWFQTELYVRLTAPGRAGEAG